MNHGKNICKELKAVRRRIAEENGIELEIPECTYQGPCKGTCPRCESEVRYLENALAQKIRMGKVATVAGLALTLGVTGSAAAQSTISSNPADTARVCQEPRHFWIEGVVRDEKTEEPLPFVNIIVKKDGKMVTGAYTDFDGNFKLKLGEGEYEFTISYVGYVQKIFPVKVPIDKPLDVIELEPTAQPLEGIVIIEAGEAPLIDPSSSGQESEMKIDGVPLRIQY